MVDDNRANRISRRKLEHLQLALAGNVDTPSGAGWTDVVLIHDCLPEVDMDEIDLSTDFLGYPLRAPLWITGMTGGHGKAAVINGRLAAAAQRHGLAMGLGSQRAALESHDLMATYEIARHAAPHAVLVANIGAPQLIAQGNSPALTLNTVEEIIRSIGAQALAIHLNFLQEVVQPEGDRHARGCLAAIERIVRDVSVPVMVKETGAGISRRCALELVAAGVSAIDLGGFGGTSMTRIEGRRGQDDGTGRSSLASAFDTWGIPTAASVIETRNCGIPVIATGGIRSGLDAAKALALGAHAVGVGRPFLLAAQEGDETLDAALHAFLQELRTALFLTGSRTPQALRHQPVVLRGELREWADQRGD